MLCGQVIKYLLLNLFSQSVSWVYICRIFQFLTDKRKRKLIKEIIIIIRKQKRENIDYNNNRESKATTKKTIRSWVNYFSLYDYYTYCSNNNNNNNNIFFYIK